MTLEEVRNTAPFSIDGPWHERPGPAMALRTIPERPLLARNSARIGATCRARRNGAESWGDKTHGPPKGPELRMGSEARRMGCSRSAKEPPACLLTPAFRPPPGSPRVTRHPWREFLGPGGRSPRSRNNRTPGLAGRSRRTRNDAQRSKAEPHTATPRPGARPIVCVCVPSGGNVCGCALRCANRRLHAKTAHLVWGCGSRPMGEDLTARLCLSPPALALHRRFECGHLPRCTPLGCAG